MARPKIGIFGALVALGGYMAFRYVQRGRSAQASAARELSRWEGEGGAVAAASAAPSVNEMTAVRTVPVAPGVNGAAHPNGDGGAWPFPRG